MANRYLTHFATILIFHVLILVCTWQIAEKDFKNLSSQIGSTVLKIQVASQVLSSNKSHFVPSPKLKNKNPALSPSKTLEQIKSSIDDSKVEGLLSASESASLLESYKAELREKINQNKFYPIMSKRLGQTGIVVVAFTLLEDGHIIDVRIDSPSPYERLNDSALEAVKRVHKFRPIPKELGETRMDLKVPVRFFTI
ncbi:MAG: energy transducer TonB [Bacteriovoracaceae bacterium]